MALRLSITTKRLAHCVYVGLHVCRPCMHACTCMHARACMYVHVYACVTLVRLLFGVADRQTDEITKILIEFYFVEKRATTAATPSDLDG